MKISSIILTVISTALLVVNQISLKMWISNNEVTLWPLNKKLVYSILSPEILVSLLSIIIGGVIWIYLLKKIEFGILYPMISISYIWGLIAAKYVFHEDISVNRWIGVGIIMVGIFLIVRK